jgi:uncharacterized membrane protein YqaE (UPF0057 family)
MKLLRLILAIALPPVAVFLTFGVSSTLVINILLTLLGWLPGSIHALWVVTKYDEQFGQIDG